MEEPILKEVSVSASIGAKVQLVKFELTSDFHLHMGSTWTMPEDWSEKQCCEFRRMKINQIRDELEPLAEKEYVDLMKQKEELNR